MPSIRTTNNRRRSRLRMRHSGLIRFGATPHVFARTRPLRPETVARIARGVAALLGTGDGAVIVASTSVEATGRSIPNARAPKVRTDRPLFDIDPSHAACVRKASR